jgi:hypothetical protein
VKVVPPGVELLIDTGCWLDRDDFTQACSAFGGEIAPGSCGRVGKGCRAILCSDLVTSRRFGSSVL